ncbi:MAG: hypothetical protein ABSG33_05200 [Candidatus Bathyarchaeia archaeon]|jgi:hypothetical protein
MKVGTKFEYPDWRLQPTLIDNLQKMWGKFGTNPIDDKKMLAVFLGHTGITGGYLSKIAAMRVYGLIVGRGFVQVSELGARIAHPTKADDPFSAVKEAIVNIPLWKIFYEKYTSKNVELPDVDFWVDLKQIAEIVPDDAKKISQKVRNDYLDDIHYLNSLKGTQNEANQMQESLQINTSEANPKQGQSPQYTETAPYTLSSGDLLKGLFEQGAYDLAKKFIDFMAEKKKTVDTTKSSEALAETKS